MQRNSQKGIIIREGTNMGLQSDNGDGSKGLEKMPKHKLKGIIITEGGLQSDNGDGSKGLEKMPKQKLKGIIITEGGLQSDNGDGSKGLEKMPKQKLKGIITTEGGLQSDNGDGWKGFGKMLINGEGTSMGLQSDNEDGWKGSVHNEDGWKGSVHNELSSEMSAGVVFLEVKISEMAVRFNRLVIPKPEALVREWFRVLEGHRSMFTLMNEGNQFNVEIQVTTHSSVLFFEENFLALNGAKVGDTLKFHVFHILPTSKVIPISFGRASSKWKKVFLSCCSGPKVFEP